jgi:NAD(P)-dependent dehydrogenase (short-subunit alcohol dehydrogenase family)
VAAPFWQKSLAMTFLLDVGLRPSHVACHQGADLLIAARGLVVNISSAGSRCYMHGPAYGAGKAGGDKMSFDMARDFRSVGVSVVSLRPGLVRTERLARVCAAELDKYGNSFGTAETPQFIGRVVLALHGYPDCLEQRSGRVF